MSIEDKDDLTQHLGENFKFINRNDTDFDSFNKLQERIDSTFEDLEKQRSVDVRRKRLVIWDDNTPPRWRGASLSKVEKKHAQKIIELLREDHRGSFFLTGRGSKDKNYHAYAIMRKLIGAGKLAPSRIKIISEDTILGYSQTGFDGRAKIDEILSDEYDAFIIDNIGSKDFYDPKREIPVLEQILLNIYNRSLPAIFVSNISVEDFYSMLGPGPADKMQDLLENRVLNLGTNNRASSKVNSKKLNNGLLENPEDSFDG